jgi:hypothetical protein
MLRVLVGFAVAVMMTRSASGTCCKLNSYHWHVIQSPPSDAILIPLFIFFFSRCVVWATCSATPSSACCPSTCSTRRSTCSCGSGWCSWQPSRASRCSRGPCARPSAPTATATSRNTCVSWTSWRGTPTRRRWVLPTFSRSLSLSLSLYFCLSP